MKSKETANTIEKLASATTNLILSRERNEVSNACLYSREQRKLREKLEELFETD